MSLSSIRQRFSSALTPRHREIMRRIALGESRNQIAQDLGISPVRISHIVSSPLFQIELQKMCEQVDNGMYDGLKEMRKLVPGAVQAMADTVSDCERPILRFHAARDILNRTGVAVPKQHQIFQETMTYEERLHQVRIKFDEGERPDEDNPIEVIGVGQLSLPADEDDDE